MKIPKYVLNLMNRKRQYAMRLAEVSCQLDDWLEQQGIDLSDPSICDAVVSGCMIYCEPSVAYSIVKNYIENYKSE